MSRTWRQKWPGCVELLTRLVEGVPCRYPVRVSSRRKIMVDGRECWGVTWLHTRGARHFRIAIDATCSDALAREWLLHEYAHALAWGKEKEEHDKAWSDAWGDAYRAAWVRPASVPLCAMWEGP